MTTELEFKLENNCELALELHPIYMDERFTAHNEKGDMQAYGEQFQIVDFDVVSAILYRYAGDDVIDETCLNNIEQIECVVGLKKDDILELLRKEEDEKVG
jgi:hypothetical protein